MSDPNNPSGALPGDPRHGLSEAELKQYYMTKSPCWYIRARLNPDGGAEARASANDPHLAYLRSHRDQIRFAGPLLDDDGEAVDYFDTIREDLVAVYGDPVDALKQDVEQFAFEKALKRLKTMTNDGQIDWEG